MAAILIAMVWVDGFATGGIVGMQEFTSRSACEDAVRKIEYEAEKVKIRAFCVNK